MAPIGIPVAQVSNGNKYYKRIKKKTAFWFRFLRTVRTQSLCRVIAAGGSNPSRRGGDERNVHDHPPE